MNEIEIPVEVQAYIMELRFQNSQLTERCAALAGQKAGAEAQLNLANQNLELERGRVRDLESEKTQ